MDTRSQIFNKIRELEKQNNMREEKSQEAEREMAGGNYTPDPVVEQVRPGSKREKTGKRTVSVQRKRVAEDETPVPTNQMSTSNPGAAEEEYSKEALNDSFRNMESLLQKPDRQKNVKKITVSVPKEEYMTELEKANSENNTAPKYRGPHRIGSTRVKYVDLEGRPLEEFCIIDTITGEISKLSRDSMIIGKSVSSNIVIDNRFVSRRHARIFKIHGEYFIEDLGSTNGTYIGGDKLVPGEPRQLEIGDTITLAASKVIFEMLK